MWIRVVSVELGAPSWFVWILGVDFGRGLWVLVVSVGGIGGCGGLFKINNSGCVGRVRYCMDRVGGGGLRSWTPPCVVLSSLPVVSVL